LATVTPQALQYDVITIINNHGNSL